jgi:hypothetical protein
MVIVRIILVILNTNTNTNNVEIRIRISKDQGHQCASNNPYVCPYV